jgi:hypothetical protein
VRRLKQLEAENVRLKKLVAARDIEIEVMKEVAATTYLLTSQGPRRHASQRSFLTGNELGGEMIDTLPHHGEIGRHRFELLQIRRRSVGRGLRRQPAKLRMRARYHLSDSVAV